jgi:hypothetical protein
MSIMTKRLGWILAPMLALAVVSLGASDDRAVKPAAAGKTRSMIIGSAWNSDNSAIAGASVRLRNVLTGKVEAVGKANETGQFTFESVERGTYVVELVTESGHVRAVGNVFTIAPGETVATFVRLDAKTGWVAGMFSSTAASVAAAAASEGIPAIAPTGPCQSPPCH